MTWDEWQSKFPERTPLKKREGFKARCPAHEDTNPSFAAWLDNDGRWVKLKCLAGCSEEAILSAMGLTVDDRDTKRGQTRERQRNGPERVEYVYRDMSGQYVMTKIRLGSGPGKRFFFEVREHNGQPTQKSPGKNGQLRYPTPNEVLSDADRDCLYRIMEVRAAIDAGKRIHICEGEKAVDALWANGEAATCTAHGGWGKTEQPKWSSRHTEQISGAHEVYVWADRDEVGEATASSIARLIRSRVGLVRIVESKTKEAKDDAFDHLKLGYRIEEAVLRPDLMPKIGIPGAVLLADVDEERPKMLWNPYLRLGQLNLINAAGGSGKSTLLVNLAAMVSQCRLPFGATIDEPITTLYFGTEDSAGELKVRFMEAGGDPRRFLVYEYPLMLEEEGMAMLEEEIRLRDARMVIFDPIIRFIPKLRNEWGRQELTQALERIRPIVRRTGAAEISVGHFSKADMSSNPAASLQSAGSGPTTWRDLHRSQLLVVPHADQETYPGRQLVFHAKASMLVEPGKIFGYSWFQGQFGFIRPDDIDLDRHNAAIAAKSAKGGGSPGRPRADDRQLCNVWLHDLLASGDPVRISDIIELGKLHTPPFDKSMIYRVFHSTPYMLAFKDNEGRAVWALEPGSAQANPDDPFSEPPKTPYWVDL